MKTKIILLSLSMMNISIFAMDATLTANEQMVCDTLETMIGNEIALQFHKHHHLIPASLHVGENAPENRYNLNKKLAEILESHLDKGSIKASRYNALLSLARTRVLKKYEEHMPHNEYKSLFGTK